MMNKLFLLAILLLLAHTAILSQVIVKHEYMGKSSYRDKENNDANNHKGSANVYTAGVNIPLSLKLNEHNRPTMWSIAFGGSYASLDNKNFAVEDELLDEILNMQLAVTHLRPLKEKMSLLVSVGGGIFMGDTRFSKIRGKHLLATGAGVVIWHINPNLDLGGGLALNNTFGYPMVFPALYLNWRLDGKFRVNTSLMNGMNISGSYSPNKYLDLGIVAEMNGQMALLEKDGKDMVFTHQYITVGFQPKVNLNKHFNLSFTGGIQAYRPAFLKRRTMRAFFGGGSDDEDPYFKISPYFSTALNYNF